MKECFKKRRFSKVMKKFVLAHWKNTMSILVDSSKDILELSRPPKWSCWMLAISFFVHLAVGSRTKTFLCIGNHLTLLLEATSPWRNHHQKKRFSKVMKMLILAQLKSAMAILIELLEDILEISGPPKWPCYNLAVDQMFSHMYVRTWVMLLAIQQWNAILTSSSKGSKCPRHQISYIWNAKLVSSSKGSKCPRHQLNYIQGDLWNIW